ncbi:MAG: polysaccharide biosynthesis C-terminal domain-containing protein, partial [Oscillospiraceae bacterium]|nr:polysaccharide biosynthesis C-terminal domain-containing protein [Oscillospiraceae bacterium]
VICLCLTYPAFSLLQAIGKAQLPVYLMLPALAVKLAGNLLLVPKYGVTGAGISTSLCYAVILTGALLALRRALGEPLQLRRFLLPQSFSALACASAAWVVYSRMIGSFPQRIAFLCAAGAGGAVYLGTLLLVRLDECVVCSS